jgi:autotransporter family porin
MKKRFPHRWQRVLFILETFACILMLIVLTVATTQRPQALWKIVAPLYVQPPSAASIAGGFTTLPPDSTLPSEQECAARVHRSSWEPRPDNTTANQQVPTQEQLSLLAPWNQSIGVDPRANGLLLQITGNFTGTTDEIIQWVACKWGIDENIVRAEAVVETDWHQSFQGDYTHDKSYCPPDTWDGNGCYQSYGLLQVKYAYFQGTWPMSHDDTAFSLEYAIGVIRTCYEGWTTYLQQRVPPPGYPAYHAGDLWGCIGRWYSGSWYDSLAQGYIQKVKAAYNEKAWLQADF